MKLQFKQYAHQEYAIHAVVDCFSGQPNVMSLSYIRDVGKVPQQQTMGLKGIGYKNVDLQISPAHTYWKTCILYISSSRHNKLQ